MSNRYQAGIITASYNGLKVPDAPTIGAATAGDSSVSVAFTAPSNVGGGAITGYTAIATPGGATGTGASSPITVSGLSNGTAYTFRVFATNTYGPSAFSAASNSATPFVLAIGDAFGGGYYAGKISTSANGVATHYLVVADKTVGQAYGKQWGPSPATTGFTSLIDGPTNSAGEAALGSTYEAATFCENLNTGGYTDWYLPAWNELEVLYYFLKPSTTINNTLSGSNANAVSPEPISTDYTTGSPPQTSATSFRTGASSQEFTVEDYWASSELNSTRGYIRSFLNGDAATQTKTVVTYYTRAIRRVAV